MLIGMLLKVYFCTESYFNKNRCIVIKLYKTLGIYIE